MPLKKTKQGWFWGSKGPFADKAKALQVARAAYASGYKEQSEIENLALEPKILKLSAGYKKSEQNLA